MEIPPVPVSSPDPRQPEESLTRTAFSTFSSPSGQYGAELKHSEGRGVIRRHSSQVSIRVEMATEKSHGCREDAIGAETGVKFLIFPSGPGTAQRKLNQSFS